MTDLVADGEVVVDNLTPAEIDRLRDAGVQVPDPDGDDQMDHQDGDQAGSQDPDGDQVDPDGDDHTADGDGDGSDADPADSDDQQGGGSGDPADDQDAEDAPDTDDSGAGSGDGSENDHDPDDSPDQQAPDDFGGDADGAEMPDDPTADPDQGEVDDGDPTDADADTDPNGDTEANADEGDTDWSDPDGDGDSTADPDGDDLADELDDLADDPTDGWDDQDADGDSSDLGGDQDADGDPSGEADASADGGDGDPTDEADQDTDTDDEAGAGGDGAGGGGGDGDDSDGPDPDEMKDTIDQLKDRANNRSRGDYTGEAENAPDNTDRWKKRLKRARRNDDLKEARDARDERLRQTRDGSTVVNRHMQRIDPRTDAQSLRAWMEQTDLAREIRERFEEIKKAPEDVNARTGSRIDRKRLTRFRQGDPTARDFMLRSQGEAERAQRAIGVALDLSGSMECSPEKGAWRPADPDETARVDLAKVAVAGIAIACDEIGDTFTASGFHGVNGEKAAAPLITGPNESFEYDHMDTVHANGGTPMGYGIQKAARRLMQTNRESKTLMVVCDGEPSDPRNWDNVENRVSGRFKSVEHTARVVEEVRNAGIGVVGIGIGDVEPPVMEDIFGTGDDSDKGWLTTEGGNLPERLAEIYEGQMESV